MNIYNYFYKKTHGGQLPPQSPFLLSSMCRNAVRGIPDALVIGTSLAFTTYIGTYLYFKAEFGDDHSLDFARRLTMRVMIAPLAFEMFKVGFVAGIGLGAYRGFNIHRRGMHNIIKQLKGEKKE